MKVDILKRWIYLGNKWLIRILNSNKLTILVLLFFVLQSMWVALSLRFPLLFDESFHFDVTKVYTSYLIPVIFDQPVEYDAYGSMMYGSASLYHYVLSFPLRLFELFSDIETYQVVFLRLINIVIALLGFVYFVRLFKLLKVSNLAINAGLLIFSLMPFVTLITGSVSYDNALFLVTAMMFFYSVKIFNAANITDDFIKYLMVLIVGSLIKFTFLPIALFSFVIVIYYNYQKITNIIKSGGLVDFLKSKTVILLIPVLLTLLAMLGIRYGTSMLNYGTPIPDCNQVMSSERCESNGVYRYVQDQIETKDQRLAVPPEQYFQNWTRTVTQQIDTSAGYNGENQEIGESIGLNAFFYTTFFFSGIAVCLLYWHRVKFKNHWILILLPSLGLVVTTIIFNMMSYYTANTDLNVQVRYLMTVLPLLFVMTFHLVVDYNVRSSIKRYSSGFIVFTIICLSLHGGGVTKHILSSNDSWYWQSEVVKDINNSLDDVLEEVIYESPIY